MSDVKYRPGWLSRPIRLVHLTMTSGVGGGMERMDAMYHRFLDRSLFDPVFVAMNEKRPGVTLYDPTIPYIYTGREHIFRNLVGIMGDADIVQFSGGFDPIACEAAIAAEVPVLVELMHLTEPGGMYPQIDMSICVSGTVRRAQPGTAPAVVIHNGIDPAEFLFRDEPRTGGKMILLESSRREKPKYFHLDDLAPDILPIGPGIELWLAGRGHDGVSTDRVKFLGLRSGIARLYREADAMILLSKAEPFGLVALEAMASGCLPIASDDGGMAEIITHGVDGWLVNAADRREVVETIRQAAALRGSEKWEEMRRAARDKVEREFTAGMCVRKYERVYLDLVERKGLRTSPGPAHTDVPPEALIGEAVYYFNAGDWAAVERVAGKIAVSSGRFRIPRVANAAALLARQAAARGHGRTASALYEKIHESGFRNAAWMEEWLSVMPDDGPADAVIADLVALNPSEPRYVMLSAERALNAGKVDEALIALREGARKNPASAELRETLELLCRRLGRNGP